MRILHPHKATGLVFPDQNGRNRLAEAVIEACAMDDFFLHGCRHLAETKMARLQIPKHIRDRLLDHAEDRGSGKVYDHHEYADEMDMRSSDGGPRPSFNNRTVLQCCGEQLFQWVEVNRRLLTARPETFIRLLHRAHLHAFHGEAWAVLTVLER